MRLNSTFIPEPFLENCEACPCANVDLTGRCHADSNVYCRKSGDYLSAENTCEPVPEPMPIACNKRKAPISRHKKEHIHHKKFVKETITLVPTFADNPRYCFDYDTNRKINPESGAIIQKSNKGNSHKCNPLKFCKKKASKRVRHTADVPNHNGYKRLYNIDFELDYT